MGGEAGGFRRLFGLWCKSKSGKTRNNACQELMQWPELGRSLGGREGWMVSKISWESDQDVVSGCTGGNDVGRRVVEDCLGQSSGKWKS